MDKGLVYGEQQTMNMHIKYGLLGLALLLGASACKTTNAAETDIKPTLRAIPVSAESVLEDGTIRKTYDDNNDGLSEVTKYFIEEADPDDPTTTTRRIVRMELDVNSDGRINVVRHYGQNRKLDREELDQDLDGKIDIVSYYDQGELAKKEILRSDSEKVDATRYYARGSILRVERDTNSDGKVDYWEYYEGGVLDRIGRDFNADGRADSWQKR